MFHITVSQKDRPGQLEGTLKGRAVEIGRADDADLHLRADNVSRRHCRLELIRGLVVVSDLESTNGTYVNGEEIRSSRLVGRNDVIRIGDYRIRVRWLEDDGQQRPRRETPKTGASGEKNRPTAREPAPRSPWEILGVSPKASSSEIRQAYLRLVRQYHPDRVSDLAPELIAIAEQRTREINAAWEVLRCGPL